MRKSTRYAALFSLSLGFSAAALASDRTVEVEIANISNATYFTPLLVAAHDSAFHLFRAGEAASAAAQAMAEGGDLAALIAEVSAADGRYVEDPAGGLLAPGDSTTATFAIHSDTSRLSLVAMLLPTNDGFVGLDALKVPHQAGVYTYFLSGFDAGTEANDELITGGGAPGEPGIPFDPGELAGSGGTGVAGQDHNPNIHLHRGVVGDFDEVGGPSDLDAGVHRWLNPVAKVILTVWY